MSDNDSIRRRTFVKGTGAAAAGAVVTSGVAAAGNHEQSSGSDSSSNEGDESDDVKLIGHRGFAGVDPENTLRAVRNASRGGTSSDGRRRADMIEVDIMPCGGGEIVVFHDNFLADRDDGEQGLTDAENTRVFETDCETVLSAEVLDSGETVPLLTEVMDAIPPHVGVNLEFKNPGEIEENLQFGQNLSGWDLREQKDIWRPFTEDVLAIAADFENDILVSSFYEAAIATVREADPSVPVAFLFWDDIEAGLDVTDEYDCDAMNVPYNMVQGSPFFSDDIGYGNVPEDGYADEDLVAAADERGIDLNVWTVQSWYQAEQLVDAGVDGLISDFPNVL